MEASNTNLKELRRSSDDAISESYLFTEPFPA
eukprot:SAG31_NODE_2657_length_5286_cov_7.817235_2_plen_32_part_00